MDPEVHSVLLEADIHCLAHWRPDHSSFPLGRLRRCWIITVVACVCVDKHMPPLIIAHRDGANVAQVHVAACASPGHSDTHRGVIWPVGVLAAAAAVAVVAAAPVATAAAVATFRRRRQRGGGGGRTGVILQSLNG